MLPLQRRHASNFFPSPPSSSQPHSPYLLGRIKTFPFLFPPFLPLPPARGVNFSSSSPLLGNRKTKPGGKMNDEKNMSLQSQMIAQLPPPSPNVRSVLRPNDFWHIAFSAVRLFASGNVIRLTPFARLLRWRQNAACDQPPNNNRAIEILHRNFF